MGCCLLNVVRLMFDTLNWFILLLFLIWVYICFDLKMYEEHLLNLLMGCWLLNVVSLMFGTLN